MAVEVAEAVLVEVAAPMEARAASAGRVSWDEANDFPVGSD